LGRRRQPVGRGRHRRQGIRPRLHLERPRAGQRRAHHRWLYINAAQTGEPPGRWWGPGAQALGFTCRQVVERKPYDAVYQQRDPRTGAKLGRARGRYATFADHLAQLKAAEPHATAERGDRAGAGGGAGDPAARRYTDVTVSFSKSISVLHASIRENARRARLEGDGRALAYWSGWEERFRRSCTGPTGRAGTTCRSGPGQPGPAITVSGWTGRSRAGSRSGPDRDVVAAGHQPGRRPAGSHSQPDRGGSPGPFGMESGGRWIPRACAQSWARCKVSPRRRWSVS